MAARKFLTWATNAFAEVAAVLSSAGAANAGDIPALDNSGKLDISFMPAGVGSDTQSATASEALSAGNLVNLYNNAGALNARKADASASKPADGFVVAAVANGGTATVYMSGNNNQVTGLTPGDDLFLSDATPGALTNTAPTTTGHLAQRVGRAISATNFEFVRSQPITRA